MASCVSVRKDILSAAVSETTIHGLPRVISSRHWLLRLLWAIAFCGFVMYSIVELNRSVERLMSRPTSTLVETNKEDFIFPDIHVCNQALISPSYTAEMPSEKLQFVTQTMENIQEILSQIESPVSVYSLGKLFMSTVNYSFISRYMGHRKEQMFIGANLQPSTSNLDLDTDVMDLRHHFYLNCFTIRVTDAASLHLLKNLMGYLDISIYVDSNYNVTVKYFGQQLDVRGLGFVTYETLLSSGVRVFFTQKSHYPDEYTPSVYLSPGYSHYVSLKMSKVNLTEEKETCINDGKPLRALDPRSGKMVEFSYGLATCYAQKLNEIFNSNNCYLPGYMPLLYEYRNLASCCNVSRLLNRNVSEISSSELNQLKLMLKSVNNLSHSVIQVLNKGMQDCQNKKPCKNIIYEPFHSSVMFPLDPTSTEMGNVFSALTRDRTGKNFSVPGREWMMALFENAKGGDTSAKDKLRMEASANVLRLIVKAAESTSTVYKQEISFTFPDLLSSIGGLLGLFMGCSVLTLLELFEVLFCLVVGRYSTWSRRESTRVEDLRSDQTPATSVDKLEDTL